MPAWPAEQYFQISQSKKFDKLQKSQNKSQLNLLAAASIEEMKLRKALFDWGTLSPLVLRFPAESKLLFSTHESKVPPNNGKLIIEFE